MGYNNVKYVLNSVKYATAIEQEINLQLNLSSKIRLLPQDDVVKLINTAELYDRERQKSTTFRLYGRLDQILTNELEDNYTKSKLELVSLTGDPKNYNIQILYPESSTNYCPLFNFNNQIFPYSCTSLYANVGDCESHTIYHGLPFNSVTEVVYNNRTEYNLKTYQHKNSYINSDDYIYIIPGKGGTLNPIYGFNSVLLNRSVSGIKNNLVIKKRGNITQNYGGSYRKVINISQDDIDFKDSLQCEPYYTGGTSDGVFIRVNGLHNVEVGDYIDLRVTGSTEFNRFYGLHRVSNIINDFIFKVNIPYYVINGSSLTNTFGQELNSGIYTYRYRKIDGVPSEYYIRKFKVLVESDRTTNILDIDYSLKCLRMCNTIWKNVNINENCSVPKQSGSNDDKITSYVINRDVNIVGLKDNLNRPLSELILGIMKRKDSEYQYLTPNFEGNLLFSGITYYGHTIELPTQNNPNVLTDYNYFNLTEYNRAGLPKNQKYYGDLCEYNPLLLEEKIIDPIYFRIGRIVSNVNVEGYVYNPFISITLRDFSEDISTVDKYTMSIPEYYETVNGSKIWREINPYGFKDITQFGVKSVNAPFTNNTHYYFNVNTLLFRRQDKNPDEQVNIILDGSC